MNKYPQTLKTAVGLTGTCPLKPLPQTLLHPSSVGLGDVSQGGAPRLRGPATLGHGAEARAWQREGVLLC